RVVSRVEDMCLLQYLCKRRPCAAQQRDRRGRSGVAGQLRELDEERLRQIEELQIVELTELVPHPLFGRARAHDAADEEIRFSPSFPLLGANHSAAPGFETFFTDAVIREDLVDAPAAGGGNPGRLSARF